MDEPVEQQHEVDELEQTTRERDEYLDALQRRLLELVYLVLLLDRLVHQVVFASSSTTS